MIEEAKAHGRDAADDGARRRACSARWSAKGEARSTTPPILTMLERAAGRARAARLVSGASRGAPPGAAMVVATACTKPADDGAAGRVLPGGSAGPGTPPAVPVLPAGGDFTLTGPGGKPYRARRRPRVGGRALLRLCVVPRLLPARDGAGEGRGRAGWTRRRRRASARYSSASIRSATRRRRSSATCRISSGRRRAGSRRSASPARTPSCTR